MDESIPNVPLTPGLLFSHPESRRDSLAMTPWTVLSAVGFAILLELTASSVALTTIVAAVLAASTIFSGARFARAYFRDYPIQAAPYFQYGMQQAIAETQKLGIGHEPVVITNKMEMPYIYVLFFENYPPARFQSEPVRYAPGPPGSSLYASVIHFDNFWFGNAQVGYAQLMRGGVVVFPGSEPPLAPPVASIPYPDGSTAYNILVK
jgi:hypothetical protein